MNGLDVLNTFRADELRLFVSAASITIGFVAIGFSLIRQRFDRLLSFFAWFAALYGVRLWMQSGIHSLMEPPSLATIKIQLSLNFLVPIPTFLFFEASGQLGRAGRSVAYAVCLVEIGLIAGVFLGVPISWLGTSNSVLIILGSVCAIVFTFRQAAGTVEAIVFRIGLAIFVALVLFTNIAGLLGRREVIEFYGFAALLCCLGYVAARRALDRNRQLSSIQQELEIARRIQLAILPTSSPAIDHFSVAARYQPMTAVAGDFYEFFDSGNGELGLLIADVSGHGVPAALIASMVKVAIQSQRHRRDDPAGLLTGMNQALCGNTQNQFVTAGYLYLDPGRSRFAYAGAGHPPMLLLRDGSVSTVEENGLILAFLPAAPYRSITQPLQSGDRLLLYTDGILEAAGAGGEEFGAARLAQLLAASAGKPAEETAGMILDRVNAWSESQSDDLTLIVCDYK